MAPTSMVQEVEWLCG